jgi:hypothetical protein
VPLHRKKLRPDPGKVYGFGAFPGAILAIIGNFALEIAHIREGLSSEQFCADVAKDESCMLTQA